MLQDTFYHFLTDIIIERQMDAYYQRHLLASFIVPLQVNCPSIFESSYLLEGIEQLVQHHHAFARSLQTLRFVTNEEQLHLSILLSVVSDMFLVDFILEYQKLYFSTLLEEGMNVLQKNTEESILPYHQLLHEYYEQIQIGMDCLQENEKHYLSKIKK